MLDVKTTRVKEAVRFQCSTTYGRYCLRRAAAVETINGTRTVLTFGRTTWRKSAAPKRFHFREETLAVRRTDRAKLELAGEEIAGDIAGDFLDELTQPCELEWFPVRHHRIHILSVTIQRAL